MSARRPRATIAAPTPRPTLRAAALASAALVAFPLAARPLGAQPAAPAGDGSPVRPLAVEVLALERCVGGASLPCVRVRLAPELPGPAAAGIARPDVALDAPGVGAGAAGAGWSGTLGPYPLELVGARAARGGGAPRAVLVLVDASGSMAGAGAQAARAAVRSFLHDLGGDDDAAPVRAGVAPFASRGVAARIRAAPVTTPAAAARAVDALPAPAGNTGLFSAVAEGAERVAAAARALAPDAVAALVVITDGRNDVRAPDGRVRPGDDAGLLDGPAGSAAAMARARELGVRVFAIGAGPEPAMAELEALVGARGAAVRTALDAVALRRALADVDSALAPARELVFAVPGAERVALARAGWPVTLRLARGDLPAGAIHFAGRWPAPLVAPPAFAAAAYPTPADAPRWLAARAAAPAPAGRAVLVGGALATLAALLWWLPRLRGPAPAVLGAGAGAPPGVAASAGRTLALAPRALTPDSPPSLASSARGAGAPPGAVRPDAREVPPRRPSETTAATAVRRAAPPDAPGGARRARSFVVHPAAPSAASAPGPSGPSRSQSDPDSE